MANSIYNSARKLFSHGLIDWSGYGVPAPANWSATTYAVGDKVTNSSTHNVYMVVAQTGASAAAPTHTTTTDTVVDNVTWRYLGMDMSSYQIWAALVNTSATGGGTGMQVYSNPSNSSDSTLFVAGTSGSRNMWTEFGLGQASIANTSLIRSGALGATDNILAQLTGRTMITTTQACDAADITFTAVPDTGNFGTNIEGIVIYAKNTAGWADATNVGSDYPVLPFIDTLASAAALSIDPNGGDIVVQWNSSGIVRL